MLCQAGIRSSSRCIRQQAPCRSVLFCRMTSFIITENGNINKFAGGKVDTIYQVNDQYFDLFEEQVKELQAERSQSIITSAFHALTGTRHKTKRRHVTGITPIPLMVGMTSPAIGTGAPAVAMPPAPVETKLQPPAVSETTSPIQSPTTESQLGASHINSQSQQVVNDNSNISVCSLDSEAQQNLKSLFNERLNDKVYTTFKE